MGTRKIKDAELGGEKVYFASHAKATYLSDGRDVESAMGSKQDALKKFYGCVASDWVDDATYSDFPYRCDIALEGVTADMYAVVTFSVELATSGDYAPVCETGEGILSIWSSKNEEIAVQTIVIMK